VAGSGGGGRRGVAVFAVCYGLREAVFWSGEFGVGVLAGSGGAVGFDVFSDRSL